MNIELPETIEVFKDVIDHNERYNDIIICGAVYKVDGQGNRRRAYFEVIFFPNTPFSIVYNANENETHFLKIGGYQNKEVDFGVFFPPYVEGRNYREYTSEKFYSEKKLKEARKISPEEFLTGIAKYNTSYADFILFNLDLIRKKS